MPEAGSTGLPDTNFEFNFAHCRAQAASQTSVVRATDDCVEHQVCWMADSSQLPPRARMKVHNSVTSLRSPPSTVRPLARSTILSLSANFMATAHNRCPLRAKLPPDRLSGGRHGTSPRWPKGGSRGSGRTPTLTARPRSAKDRGLFCWRTTQRLNVGRSLRGLSTNNRRR
jgi:hypothetical protein